MDFKSSKEKISKINCAVCFHSYTSGLFEDFIRNPFTNEVAIVY
jgi:hypothetical protein